MNSNKPLNKYFKDKKVTNILVSITLFTLSMLLHYSFYKLFVHYVPLNILSNHYILSGYDPHYYASELKTLFSSNYQTPFPKLQDNFFVYFIYLIGKWLDFNFSQTIVFVPMILGSLIAPLFYVLSYNLLHLDNKKQTINKEGFFLIFCVSLFLSIYPSILHRTFAGWVDTDTVILVGLLVFFILLTKIFSEIKKYIVMQSKYDTNINNVFLYLLYLAFTISFLLLTYSTNFLIVFISLTLLSLYILYILFTNKNLSKIADIYLFKILTAILILLFLVFVILDKHHLSVFNIILLAFIISFIFILDIYLKNNKKINKVYITLILFILFLLLISTIDSHWIVSHFFGSKAYNYLIRPFVPTIQSHTQDISLALPSYRIDVTELHPITMTQFMFGSFGFPFLGLITILAYLAFLLKERKLSFYILLPVFLLGMTIFVSGNRFMIYFVIPFSYTLIAIYFFFINSSFKDNKLFGITIKDYFRLFYGAILFVYFFFILMADFRITKHISEVYTKMMANTDNVIRLLKNNNSKQSDILLWWSYGYPVSFYTERFTAPNNGNQDVFLKMFFAGIYFEKNKTLKKCYSNAMYIYASLKPKHKAKNKIFINLIKECNNPVLSPKLAKVKYPYNIVLYVDKDKKENVRTYYNYFKKNLNKIINSY